MTPEVREFYPAIPDETLHTTRCRAFPNHSSGNKGVRVRKNPDNPLSFRVLTIELEAMNPEHVHQGTITGAVITILSSRTPETDESGQVIKNLLHEAGIEVSYYALVPDRIERVTTLVLAMDHANCIILTGGTGLTPDDRTIEAVRPFLEKEWKVSGRSSGGSPSRRSGPRPSSHGPWPASPREKPSSLSPVRLGR